MPIKTREEMENKIRGLFVENAIDGIHVSNDNNGDLLNETVIIRFANKSLFNIGLKSLSGYLHPTNAFGNNQMSLLISPELLKQLENEEKYNELKATIDTAYQRTSPKPIVKKPPIQNPKQYIIDAFSDQVSPSLQEFTDLVREKIPLEKILAENNAKRKSDYINRKNNYHDMITNLFPDGAVTPGLDENGIMHIGFTNNDMFRGAFKALAGFMHPTNAINGKSLSLVISDEFKAKLDDKEYYNQLKKIINSTHRDYIPVIINQVENRQSAIPYQGFSGNQKKLLSNENIKLIEKTLSNDGWPIKDKTTHETSKEQYRTVVDKENNPKFKIYENKLTTHEANLETFIAMLKSYKAVQGNAHLPVITAHNEVAKELWKEAFNTVYKRTEVDLDKIITIATARGNRNLDQPSSNTPRV